MSAPLRRATIHHTILFGLLSAAAGAALADPSPALDRFSVSGGAFYAEPRIKVGADTSYGRIDTPDDKQGRTAIPRVKADLLVGDKHGFSFDYYRYDKTYMPAVAGNGIVNGLPMSGNANVNADLRLDLAKLAYKWWIGSGNDVFGIGAGAAYYHATIDGNARGTLNGITGTANGSVGESAYAPLLELGWRHAFTPDLRMYAEASGIRKNGGTINGHIYGGNLGVEWFPWKNVGLVADYGVSKIKLKRDSERSADLNIRLTGPSAYVKVRF